MKLISIVFLILITTLSQAKVWEATPGLHWDAFWQQKFSEWVEKEVKGDFFKQLPGGFADLRLDCADAMYALQIYFSYQNKLPWTSQAYTWRKDQDYPHGYSNEMTRWDHLPTNRDRVVALIKHLIPWVGTETLANLDTYPIAIHDIKPGDLYMYKYGSNGSYTRHTYIIKSVNRDGTFDVIYGTQLRAKKGRGLGRVGSEYLQHKPDRKNWGFKRIKYNKDSDRAQELIPGASTEQYVVAEEVDEDEFFDYINVALRTYEETPTRKVNRLLKGLCRSLKARRTVVNHAAEWNSKRPNTCMNEGDYDAYSTPSRDIGITKKYTKLGFYYQQLQENGKVEKVKSKLRLITEAIFLEEITNEQLAELKEYCTIKVSDGNSTKKANLRSFYHALVSDQASYHPNDNIFRRWGFDKGEPTKCEAHYGKKEDIKPKKKKNGLLGWLFG